MTVTALQPCARLAEALRGPVQPSPQDAAQCDAWLGGLDAEERVHWALDQLPEKPVLTSSFGAQAAVMLHLVTQAKPDIPVVLIDTGYLFPETYRFVDSLHERLSLNLHVYRPAMSAAWQEARYGHRWENGVDGLAAYNQENKVEPLQRALKELRAGTWFSGLRRAQASTRARTPFVERKGAVWKVHPIADWGDREVFRYLKKHNLPYHPLWDEGYVSIGDVHTTQPLHAVESAEQTRFFGLKRECGIHELDLGEP
ncbi:MAG: phosphoadenylyl-sulfate reductase [Pseudomonadota bacterium]